MARRAIVPRAKEMETRLFTRSVTQRWLTKPARLPHPCRAFCDRVVIPQIKNFGSAPHTAGVNECNQAIALIEPRGYYVNCAKSSVRCRGALRQQNAFYLVAVESLCIPSNSYFHLHAANGNQISRQNRPIP